MKTKPFIRGWFLVTKNLFKDFFLQAFLYFRVLSQMLKKFNLSQAMPCFNHGFVVAERTIGGFRHDDIFPFDFLYHNQYYTALVYSLREQ